MEELSNKPENLIERFSVFMNAALEAAPAGLKCFYFEWSITYYTVNYANGSLWGFKQLNPNDFGVWDWESTDDDAECSEDDDTFWVRPGTYFGPWARDNTTEYEEMLQVIDPLMKRIIEEGASRSTKLKNMMRDDGIKFYYAQHDDTPVEWLLSS